MRDTPEINCGVGGADAVEVLSEPPSLSLLFDKHSFKPRHRHTDQAPCNRGAEKNTDKDIRCGTFTTSELYFYRFHSGLALRANNLTNSSIRGQRNCSGELMKSSQVAGKPGKLLIRAL